MPKNTNTSIAVTTRDVAERARVHRTTVSRVLSDDPRISPETVARVRAALDELGYDPEFHVAARRLKSRHDGKGVVNHVIASIISLMGINLDGYYGRLFQGMLTGTAQHGFALLTTDTPDHFAGSSFEALLRVIARDEVDGVICYTLGHNRMIHDLEQAMKLSTRPLVSLMATVEGCSSVSADAAMGGFQAVTHLLELGHRQILYFNSPFANRIGEDRLRGMQEAVQAYGLSPEKVLIPYRIHQHWYSTTFLQEAIAEGLEKLPEMQNLDRILRGHPDYTAIIAWNDPSALWAWYGLQQLGWTIPHDLSLVGSDDTHPKISETGSNQLTTIHLPLEEIGEQAAKLLIEHILGQRTGTENIVLPTQLIVRGSTAAPHSWARV